MAFCVYSILLYCISVGLKIRLRIERYPDQSKIHRRLGSSMNRAQYFLPFEKIRPMKIDRRWKRTNPMECRSDPNGRLAVSFSKRVCHTDNCKILGWPALRQWLILRKHNEHIAGGRQRGEFVCDRVTGEPNTFPWYNSLKVRLVFRPPVAWRLGSRAFRKKILP